MQETGFDPWVMKIPWRRKWQPTPVFLPVKSHGQRSLVVYGLLSHNRVSHDLVTKQQQLIYYFSCRSEFFIHFLKSFHFLSFTSLNVIWYNLLKIDL